MTAVDIVELMGEPWVGWVLEVLAIPKVIPQQRQIRAASLVMADLVRDRVDISDEIAESTFTPVIVALGESLEDGDLDDVLLGRKRVDLPLARIVRRRIPDVRELPVGSDGLDTLIRAVLTHLVERAGRTSR